MDGSPPSQRFQLLVADADGENPRMILESRSPIMSPAWSADGQWLAYVSFEGRRSGVYVQRIRTGERTKVSARAGINGAPSFSPDGKRLALTLGGTSGNPDIYILDLQTQDLKRITDDPAIDTEAVWTPDGTSLYFTSDRAGAPQIYRIGTNAGERPRRMTFTGTYNARPRVSPDGTQIAMVTLDDGAYRIAVQEVANGTQRVLSKGRLDESPSFAPNGAMLIFSGSEGGRDTLAPVSAALDRFTNFHVEIGARIGELGRQPRTARRFFDPYQDRVLFGTDAVPHGRQTPQQIFGDDLYTIYFRFLETEDEYFDYAPAKVPPQGRWRIYGVGPPGHRTGKSRSLQKPRGRFR
mgnify:CR=1 FL=1